MPPLNPPNDTSRGTQQFPSCYPNYMSTSKISSTPNLYQQLPNTTFKNKKNIYVINDEFVSQLKITHIPYHTPPKFKKLTPFNPTNYSSLPIGSSNHHLEESILPLHINKIISTLEICTLIVRNPYQASIRKTQTFTV
jgi:hypothetical protein